MFILLERFWGANPSAYDRFSQLTGQLEIAGIFQNALPLDVKYGGMDFGPLRHGTWEFCWGFRVLDLEVGGAGTIVVTLNSPKACLIIKSLFNIGDPKSQKTYESELAATPKKPVGDFGRLVKRVQKTAVSHQGFLEAAILLYQYFNRVPV
jgi:hypothetical protein